MQLQGSIPAEDFERRLLAAHGYLELGMPQQAVDELNAIAPEQARNPPERGLRVAGALVAFYQQARAWEPMRHAALQLYVVEPRRVEWALSLACATRRTRGMEEAREILLRAEQEFPNESVITYHLAGYALENGEMEAAREYLRQAIAIAPRWRALALADVAFQALWGELKEP